MNVDVFSYFYIMLMGVYFSHINYLSSLQETLSASDFVDRKTVEPQKPAPLANTPFKMVETVKDLKEMSAKLRSVDEIAVCIVTIFHAIDAV